MSVLQTHIDRLWRRLQAAAAHQQQAEEIARLHKALSQAHWDAEASEARADALAAENEKMRAALVKVDEYFKACVLAWAVDDGRVVNDDGHVIAEGAGLDELCEEGAQAVRIALAAPEAREETLQDDCGESPGK